MKRLIMPVLLSLLVCGCSTNQGPLGQNGGFYYPMCYSPLQDARRLDSRALEVGKSMGRGLLAGLLAGVAGGGISALFTGNPLDLVSGAAIGAAGGAVAGGVYGATDNNQAEKDALVAQWSQEAGTPLEGLGFNGAAATASIQCYNKRFEQLNQEVKEGIITEAAAEPRRVEIELGRQEAYALLQNGQ